MLFNIPKIGVICKAPVFSIINESMIVYFTGRKINNPLTTYFITFFVSVEKLVDVKLQVVKASYGLIIHG